MPVSFRKCLQALMFTCKGKQTNTTADKTTHGSKVTLSVCGRTSIQKSGIKAMLFEANQIKILYIQKRWFMPTTTTFPSTEREKET